jgi:flavin-dependent dehydrogenase
MVDVAIIGGGLAGATLARQLRRFVPKASVAVFERCTEPDYKVGESTVEIATNYLVRRLGLGTYLYEHHLPKNGLRFFFDTPQRDAPLPRMGEIGSNALPFHPSFQLDRATLEEALCRMNVADGVQVHRGTRVHAITPGCDGSPHELEIEHEGARETLRARWLVDASGRTRLLQKTLGTPKISVNHPIAAVWGRFEGVVDIDAFGPADWRARVRNTSRHLSTNHYCYPGYWIWFIPLRGDVMSIGWVGERGQLRDAWRKPEGFLSCLREHTAVASLVPDVRCLDLKSLGQLAYGTSWFFRPEHRMAVIGEAAAFTDPFYSPGSDFIALENDFVTDLVAHDLGGTSMADLNERGLRYDAFMAFRFDATMLLYRDLYPLLGSRTLLELKWDFDIACYYNLWLQPYMLDQHLDPGWLRDQLAQREYVLAGLRNFSALFRRVEHAVRARGTYSSANLGDFVPGLDKWDFVPTVGTPRPRKAVLRKTAEIFNTVLRQGLAVLGDESAHTRAERPLYEFLLEPATFASVEAVAPSTSHPDPSELP